MTHLVDQAAPAVSLCGQRREAMLAKFEPWFFLPATLQPPPDVDALRQRAYLDAIADRATCMSCRQIYFDRS